MPSIDLDALRVRVIELREAEQEAREILMRVRGGRMEIERMIADLQGPSLIEIPQEAKQEGA